jgi:hypothetical protein
MAWPALMITRFISRRKADAAVAKSSVKLAGFDVRQRFIIYSV